MSERKQNLLANLNLRAHRVYGKSQSSKMSFGVNKGYLAPIVAALFSLMATFITHKIQGEESGYYNVIVVVFWLVTAATFCYVTYDAIKIYRGAADHYQIITDPSYKNLVLAKAKLSPRQIANGYKICKFDNGKSKEWYLISDEVNDYLVRKQLTKSKIAIDLINSRFGLAEELRKFVPSVLRRNFKQNSIFFNGKLLRMVSDLFIDSNFVSVQKVGYYDGQCSNELVFKKIKSNIALNQLFLGESLLLDGDSQLWDLDTSPCANYLGASTMVVTSDGYLVVGKQGSKTKANVGRYAPSGSGSIDYRDVKKKKDLVSVVVKAMEREFCEENNYRITDPNKIKTIVFGYVRLLERGGKPDFFGVSFLSESCETLKGKIKKRELGLQENSEFLKISPAGIGKTLLNFCEQQPAGKISIQLQLSAQLLEKYESDITNYFSGNR